LARTRRAAFGRVATLLGATEVTPGLWDELEAALIQADVGVATTSDLLQRLRARAAREGILRAADLQSALRDELRRMLAAPENGSRQLDTARPAVALIVGTNGSGKTTSIAKLASRHKRDGRKVLLVAADTFRAAAGEQLDVWADRAGVEMIGGRPGADPGAIAFDALQAAQARGFDVVLVDTAGRLHIDEELMTELSAIKGSISPTEILFVADSMIGQDAVNVAKAFDERVGLTGVILTKLDGDARGGVALSVKAVTGKPIKFIGVGEKLDAFEPFHPDRMASRILGMGDVLTLIEKAHETFDQKKAEELGQKLKKDSFTLDDFKDQIQQMRKMGSFGDILGMIPGLGKLKGIKEMAPDEKDIKRIEAIINSMTMVERRDPAVLNGNRRLRIAKGSGTTVQDVNQLVKRYAEARKMMKRFTSGGMKGLKRGMPMFR